MPAPSSYSVGFLLIPGFSLMSYAAAIEPLRAANVLSKSRLYRWWHATPDGQPAVASSGSTILSDYAVGSPSGRVDLVLVCAGGNPAEFDHPATLQWLRKLARRGVTIGGISGGPVILARAGLLDRRRCTVHWEHAPAFREAFPRIHLTRSLFELDGDRITCSGGIAALDMMVALIAQDHGRKLAAAVGDWFIHTQIREGAGPHRMDLRPRLNVTDVRLLKALHAMEAHIESPLARDELAQLAGLSLRQFERCFRASVGRGVHAHYLKLRLERAQQLLRESPLSVLEIALATGFGSASQFSRAFRRAFAQTPRVVAGR